MMLTRRLLPALLLTTLLVGGVPLSRSPVVLRPVVAVAQASWWTIWDSEAAIRQASWRWGVNYWWLRRVAMCESSLRPWAYNPSGAAGLFQFMPSTYYSYAWRIGEQRSYWDPYAAANVAGYMFRIGQAWQWTCR